MTGLGWVECNMIGPKWRPEKEELGPYCNLNL